MADERSFGYTPPEFSMTDEATASKRCDSTPWASSTLGAHTTIPAEAWKYQWNTQAAPTTDGTYNVDGDTDNESTSYQHLGSISRIHNARPSTSHASMAEASANFEDYTTISENTRVPQGNTQYKLAEGTSTVFGHTDKTETGSISFTLPVWSSRGGGDNAVASRSQTGTEEASGASVNDARNATATRGTEQKGSREFPACDQSSVKKSNHQCETCGKFMSRADNLPVHYRTHTGDKPYKCKICEISFAHISNLRRHQRIHTGMKLHICQICPRPLKNTTALKNHLKSHSNDRPFACDICSLSYKRIAHLRRHRETVHHCKIP
ncbi:zinc finger and BTB domain-containing protein 7A-like isoform X1 [Dermacentor albipictus]|uniref:zinc finger and BTB domain-containing protein 7A-like isoform X1 n=1 Tax=Dermacentor albipictus TaxID=60249 RepID=UPI0031FCC97F